MSIANHLTRDYLAAIAVRATQFDQKPRAVVQRDNNDGEVTPPYDPGPKPSPNAVLVAGSWLNPAEDCYPPELTSEDGGVGIRIRCGGATGDAIGIGLVLIVLTVGISALANLASKNPKAVTKAAFPNPGEDRIELIAEASRDPSTTRFTLDTAREMWVKSAEFYSEDKSMGLVGTRGTRRIQWFSVPSWYLDSAGTHLVLGKAKFLGVLTQMYDIGDMESFKGSDWVIRWITD
jgi:hypothetical protein